MLDDFNSDFKKTERTIKGWMVFYGVVSVASIGFTVWVIVKVLSHYGIL